MRKQMEIEGRTFAVRPPSGHDGLGLAYEVMQLNGPALFGAAAGVCLVGGRPDGVPHFEDQEPIAKYGRRCWGALVARDGGGLTAKGAAQLGRLAVEVLSADLVDRSYSAEEVEEAARPTSPPAGG